MPIAALAFDVEIDLGGGAILLDLPAIDQHIERLDVGPFDLTDGLSRFFYGCLRCLGETLFGTPDYVDDFLGHCFLLDVSGIVLRDWAVSEAVAGRRSSVVRDH